MTNLLREHCAAACRLLCAALLVALSACGPGSGGTGTGPIASYSSARTSTDGTLPDPVPGTGAGHPAPLPPPPAGCPADCGRIDLQLQDDKVELTANCARFVFIGGWETDASGQALLPGTLEVPATGASAPASLRLQFSGAPQTSQALTVTLVDNAGRTVLGPELLSQVSAIADRPPVAVCAS